MQAIKPGQDKTRVGVYHANIVMMPILILERLERRTVRYEGTFPAEEQNYGRCG